jgi:hypothetical protein
MSNISIVPIPYWKTVEAARLKAASDLKDINPEASELLSNAIVDPQSSIPFLIRVRVEGCKIPNWQFGSELENMSEIEIVKKLKDFSKLTVKEIASSKSVSQHKKDLEAQTAEQIAEIENLYVDLAHLNDYSQFSSNHPNNSSSQADNEEIINNKIAKLGKQLEENREKLSRMRRFLPDVQSP